jgi:hypothetical protein
MQAFFAELKRRHIYRVTAAYAVAPRAGPIIAAGKGR